MSAKSDTQPKAPSFEPDLLKQLLAERKTAGELEDLLKDLRMAFIEQALQGELTPLLGYEKHAVAGRKSGNSRNGASRKTIKTEDSTVEIAVPRDRNGEFEPQLIGKHERRFRRMTLAFIMAKRVQSSEQFKYPTKTKLISAPLKREVAKMGLIARAERLGTGSMRVAE